VDDIKINSDGLTLEELKLLDEPLPGIIKPIKPTNRGRKKSGKYVEYLVAKDFVRGELIQSRAAYEEWWSRHKPKDIPRFPHRIYVSEWIGWNEFLGNSNIFGIHNLRNWRPYEEAIKFIHSLQIVSYAKWMEQCKDGKLPNDIPTRPDLVYAKWRTWNHWLGNRPIEAIEAQRAIDKRSQVYYIIHEHGLPENILTFGMDTMGVASFKQKWEREHFTIIRAFWYDRDEAEYISNVVNSLSVSYLGDDRQRIVPNFWEIVYHLEQKLDRVNLQKSFEHTKPPKDKHSIVINGDDLDEYESSGIDEFGIIPM
jgi:hypothetical protein